MDSRLVAATAALEQAQANLDQLVADRFAVIVTQLETHYQGLQAALAGLMELDDELPPTQRAPLNPRGLHLQLRGLDHLLSPLFPRKAVRLTAEDDTPDHAWWRAARLVRASAPAALWPLLYGIDPYVDLSEPDARACLDWAATLPGWTSDRPSLTTTPLEA